MRAVVGLYAGWLSVATLLSLATVAPRVYDRPPALAAAAACVAVAWAVVRQRTHFGGWEAGALAVALLGGVGGAARF